MHSLIYIVVLNIGLSCTFVSIINNHTCDLLLVSITGTYHNVIPDNKYIASESKHKYTNYTSQEGICHNLKLQKYHY